MRIAMLGMIYSILASVGLTTPVNHGIVNTAFWNDSRGPENIVGKNEPVSQISWDIKQVEPGLYKYTYTLQVEQKLNHFLLEVHPAFRVPVDHQSPNKNITGDSPRDRFGGPHQGMPNSLHSLMYPALPELTTITVEFWSTCLPMWGSFYARANQKHAYNIGLLYPDSPYIHDFIAVPGWPYYYVEPIPEPATIALIGAGLSLLGIRQYRRKCRPA